VSALIGALRVTLGLETAAFEKGANLAEKKAATLGKRMSAMGSKLQGLGTKLSVGLTAPFAGLMATAIPAATKAREAMAQVETGLKTMGGASGKTAEELKASAKALQSLSTFDKNEILGKVTANLLTFGNVSGEVFDRAQKAALDLSARLGQDLQSSAIQIGKALNDPIKGITALSRVGVSFTADQKEMIKAMVEVGDVAGAQKLILSELEKQYGGSAKAARDAAPGSDTIDAWRQFQETIGEIALKVLPPLTNFLTKLLSLFNNLSPATQTWVFGIAAVGAAFGPALLAVGSMLKVVASLLPLVLKIGPAFMALQAAMTAAKVAALATLPALTPFLIPLAAIAAAVGAVYLAWRNWDKITAIVQRMVTGVTAWLDKLRAPFDWVVDKTKKVGDAFFKLYDRVVGHSYVPDMVDGIAAHMRRLHGVMVVPAQQAAKLTAEAFAGLEQRIAFLLDRLFPAQARHNQFLADLRDLEIYAKRAGWSVEELEAALKRLTEDYWNSAMPASEAIRDIGEQTRETTRAVEELAEKSPFQRWAETIPQTMAQIREAMQEVAAYGLDRLADGIAAVMTGSQKLGDMFRDVARQMLHDMIRLAARMLILRALMSALPGLFGGGGAAGGITPGLQAASDRFLAAGGYLGKRAMGGPIRAGKPYLVGERGPELIMPRASGFVVPNHALGLGGSNGGRGGTTVIHMSGVITNDEFWAEIDRRDRTTVAAAAPAIVRASTMHTARSLNRPRLG